jgi:hypothetical protein
MNHDQHNLKKKFKKEELIMMHADLAKAKNEKVK